MLWLLDSVVMSNSKSSLENKLNVSLDQEIIRLAKVFSSPTFVSKSVTSDPGLSACAIDASISTREKVKAESSTRLLSVALHVLTWGLLFFSNIHGFISRRRVIGTVLTSRCFCKHKNKFKTWASRIVSVSRLSLAVLFSLIYLLSCWVRSLQDWLLAD